MSYFTYLKRGIQYVFKGTPVKKITADISYLQPNDRLKNQKIIITGGGRGLGASMARKLVSEGAEVLIAGRNEEVLKHTAQQIGCQYLQLDLQNVDCFDTFVQSAARKLGGITTLVNNAGISLHETSFFDVTPKSFDSQINTNFRGTFFLTQSFIKYLKEKNSKGNVIFISSETGETVDYRPYGFTKAAINSMTKGLAYLFAKDSIRINAVAPGVTSSDMTGYKADDNLYCSYNHTERVYLPEEVAEVVCFILSDASACMSGQILTCNNAKTVNARWK